MSRVVIRGDTTPSSRQPNRVCFGHRSGWDLDHRAWGGDVNSRCRIGVAICGLLLIIALSLPAVAIAETHVSGIISADTTWTPEGSPYLIDRVSHDVHVQVAADATLTLLPGTRVIKGTGDLMEVWGNVDAAGTSETPVAFDGVKILPGSGASGPELSFDFCRFRRCRVSLIYRPGTIRLRHSVVIDSSSEMQLNGYCDVIGNIFNGQAHISTSGSPISDNVFYKSSGGVFGWQNNSEVHGNNFIDCYPGVVALDTSGALNATGNWWGTTDPAVIDSLIRDHNDDLSINHTVQYIPFLTAPNPLAPSFESIPPTTLSGVSSSWVSQDVTVSASAVDNAGGSGVFDSYLTPYTDRWVPDPPSPQSGSIVIVAEGISRISLLV